MEKKKNHTLQSFTSILLAFFVFVGYLALLSGLAAQGFFRAFSTISIKQFKIMVEIRTPILEEVLFSMALGNL